MVDMSGAVMHEEFDFVMMSAMLASVAIFAGSMDLKLM